MADGGDVGGAASFDGYVDHRFPKAYTVVCAVVEGLDNVGALVGQYLRQLMQRARSILKIDADAQQAPIFYQASLDDLGQQGNVDVAARDQIGRASCRERV